MEIRNCIIITNSDSWIEIRPDELTNFSGNRVFCRSKLPDEVFDMLKTTVDSTADKDTVSHREGQKIYLDHDPDGSPDAQVGGFWGRREAGHHPCIGNRQDASGRCQDNGGEIVP